MTENNLVDTNTTTILTDVVSVSNETEHAIANVTEAIVEVRDTIKSFFGSREFLSVSTAVRVAKYKEMATKLKCTGQIKDSASLKDLGCPAKFENGLMKAFDAVECPTEVTGDNSAHNDNADL